MRAIHLALNLFVDLVLQFQDIEFLGQQDADLPQAGEGIKGFQDMLALGQRDVERRCDEIGEPARIFQVHGRYQRFFWNDLAQ